MSETKPKSETAIPDPMVRLEQMGQQALMGGGEARIAKQRTS